jgi:hypothetical protein
MEKLGLRFRLAPSFTLLCVAAAAVVSAAACSSGTPTVPCTPPDSPACTEGCDADETACNGVCVDTQTSAEHCGACGEACGDDQACVDGACVDAPACGDGLTRCGEDCVNLALSPEHCGGCGQACDEGQACIDGACEDADACDDGLTRCGEDCADLETSAEHCGGCGQACDDGQACVDGACGVVTCDDGLTLCGDECVDTQTSAGHCGGCGDACDDGQACVDGACEDAPCDDDALTRCGGVCVDLETSAAHCGGCGDACDDGQLCVDGACEVDECIESGGTRCDGACVDTQTDAQHCGACGEACGAAQICQAGRCACTVAPDRDIGSTVPRSVTGTTVGGSSAYNPSCVAASSNEHVISFTAPSAGVYSFDASKSEYEAVIAVIDAGGCAELACSAEPGAASVKVSLALDQTVYIVVDGADGATGAFVVDVTRDSAPTCPAGAFGPEVPSHISGSTVGRPNSVRPTETEECRTGVASDAGYTFTAPVAGDYTFDTYGSDFDTLLHIHAAACNGEQLACNDDYQGKEQSSVTVTLAAGEAVVVVVDGVVVDGATATAGQFVLNVNRAVPPPVCDNTGFCGDSSTEGCRMCALDGNCRPAVDACFLNRDCQLFLDCSVIDCHDADDKEACVAACADEHPQGAELAMDIETCVHCNECRNDCSDRGFTCP